MDKKRTQGSDDGEGRSDSAVLNSEKSFFTCAISRDAYSPYGSLIAFDETLPFKYANMRTAKRIDHLASVENLRPDGAQLNVCLFHCSPIAKLPLEIKLLEKHPHSTQIFLPMTSNARFLVIVCLGGETPDLSTLKAFEAISGQGISYKPGVWHYPMTAIEETIDFACLINEDGSADDCTVFALPEPVTIASA
jgi:ureidoglycolate hydrolase